MIAESYPSKRRRYNTAPHKANNASAGVGSSGDFSDILEPLRSEDVLIGAGLGALTSGDFMMRLKSADIVKDILLPESAVTAAAAAAMATAKDQIVPSNLSFRASSGNWIKDLEIGSGDLLEISRYLPSLLLGNHPSSSKGDAGEASTSPLPISSWADNHKEYQVNRQSSWSKSASLRSLKNATRISSGDWVGGFKNESVNLWPMHPSLFVASMTEKQLNTSPPPLSVPLASQLAHHPHPSAPKSSLKKSANHSSTTSAAGPNAPPSTSTASKKKKKSRKRTLDETIAMEPTDGDVLSGRGGFTNTHPGNVRFRKRALEFRSWYKESSKEKKQEIADLLVDSVRNEGNRFLGKGKDGLWHEMTGNGPHRKASQALRERIKGGDGK